MKRVHSSLMFYFHMLVFLFFICADSAGHAAQPLSVYGNLPGFEAASISPSGDHVALIGTTSEQRRLLVLDKSNKLVFQLGVQDIKTRGIYWAGDDRVMLIYSTTYSLGVGFIGDKAELYSAVVIPLSGEKPWQVFDGYKEVFGGISNFYGLRETNGKWYGYFSGIAYDSNGKRSYYLGNTSPSLYEVDMATKETHLISKKAEDYEKSRTWLVNRQGVADVRLDFQTASGNWSLWNGQSAKIAAGVSPTGDVGLVGYGAEESSVIYMREDSETSILEWFETPLSGGRTSAILVDEDIENTYLDQRSNKVLGFRRSGDVPSYHFFDARHSKIAAAVLKAFPGVSAQIVDWNDKFDRLIVQTEGVADPQTWWMVDIGTGKADILGTSYAIPAAEVAPMKMIHYKAADGLDIAAVLTVPAGRPAENLPIVVLPHGGPSARDYPGFDWWAQALASRGYAVLQPNFRGSTGYGINFRRAGHGEWGRKMQTDISDGLAHVVKLGIADGQRACIMGASYGGYAALAGVTLQNGVYRCAVSVSGVSDVQKMVYTDIRRSGGDQTLRRALEKEVGLRRDLKSVSPIRFADKADAPILLIHGKDDTVVEYSQSADMAAALRSAGKPVEFLTLKGEDHWLSRSATRNAMLQAAVAFLEKHNPVALSAERATQPLAGAQKAH